MIDAYCEESFEIDADSPAAIPEKRCYNVEELQIILSVSRQTVYKLIHRNQFRSFQIDGGKWRISKKSFDEWLDSVS